MKDLNVQYGTSDNAFAVVDGIQVPMTLEVMNALAPNEMNGEFYASYESMIAEIESLKSGESDCDDESRDIRIAALEKALEVTKTVCAA